MKKFILAVLVTTTISLSGCVTSLVIASMVYDCNPLADSCSPPTKLKVADEYFAIGRPSTPMVGYDQPLILLGKKSSVIIEMPNEDKDLFERVLNERILLPHLNVSLASGNGNPRSFYIERANRNAERITGYAGLYYAKPVNLFTDRERIALEKLGFKRGENRDTRSCYKDGYGDSNGCGIERVHYSKDFTIKMSPKGIVNNATLITHNFKEPVEMRFYQK